MKKSVVQCIAGSLGMFLVIVGVIWICQKLSSPPQLNAASNAPEVGNQQINSSKNSQTEKTSLFFNETSSKNLIKNDTKISFSGQDSQNQPDSRIFVNGSTKDVVLMKPSNAAERLTLNSEVDNSLSEKQRSEEFSDNISPPKPVLNIPMTSTESEFNSNRSNNVSNNAAELSEYSYPTSDPYSPDSLAEVPFPTTANVSPIDSSMNQEPSQLQTFNYSDYNEQTPHSFINQSNTQSNSSNRSVEQVAPMKEMNSISSIDERQKNSSNLAMNAMNQTNFQSNDNLSSLNNPNLGVGRPGAEEINGPQQAQITLEKIIPEEIQVGQESEFKIILKNIGQTTAKNVELKDCVPAGTILIATKPQASSIVQGEMFWNGFDLKADESREFSFTILPQEEGEIGSVATIAFQTEISGKTRCTRPMLQLKVDAPQEVLIGENVTLNITVSNPGSGTATGIVILENIPEGLYHPSGNVLDNRIETLKPKESKTVSLTLQSVAPGLIENHLKVSADNNLFEEMITQIQVNAPELSLAINGSKLRYLEREAVYNLTVENPGTATAKEVKLVAELPREVDFVSANNLGVYNPEKHSVHWVLSELPNNAQPGEIELVLLPQKMGAGNIVFRGDGENNLTAEISQEIIIDGLPAVSYEVKALTDPVEVGRDAIYEIRISNRGTKESTNVSLKIMLPEEMKILASDGPTRCNEMVGGISFDNISKIDAKSEIVYKIKAVCSVPGDHRIKVDVSSDDLEPLVKEESIRVFN